MSCTRIPTDETFGYESSVAREKIMTYADEVELRVD